MANRFPEKEDVPSHCFFGGDTPRAKFPRRIRCVFLFCKSTKSAIFDNWDVKERPYLPQGVEISVFCSI
jgi:hypothetical protein